jgi:hypothetical protein
MPIADGQLLADWHPTFTRGMIAHAHVPLGEVKE